MIKWDFKILSDEEYEKIPEYEKNNFCHQRGGIHWLYPDQSVMSIVSIVQMSFLILKNKQIRPKGH